MHRVFQHLIYIYELNVINLMIFFCVVFIVLSKYVDADPQLLIAY